ncbi:XRE family transcriptional regulator [Emticicia fluvialis]|uniref:XRE family transcriptional regulator n=1 Tax=Emticicia fluvialis TaxID=2974474 RepID=UPI002165EAD8|nr:LexA family transcriptional regulator [Emticicia fluvialis]
MEKNIKTQLQIAQNIKLLRLHKGVSQEQLADTLGISPSRLSNYETGTRAIPIDLLNMISSHFHIALDAITKSDLSKIDMRGIMQSSENRLLFPILISENEKYQGIEVVPVKASAGYLKGYADPEFIEKLPTINVPFIAKGSGMHRAFPITGDSMLPIPDDAIIIGRHVESLKAIKNGHCYIIVSEDGIVFKRVFDKIAENGFLHLVSDNKLYKPYKIAPETIYELWEYKGYFSAKVYKEDEFSFENLFFQMRGLTHNIDQFKERMEEIVARSN